MVKRRRNKGSEGHTTSKRTKCNETALSEISLPEEKVLIHDAPPPAKNAVMSHEPLTFPMGRQGLALPQCEGAKLKPFANGNVQVNFVRELGGNAVHSNVFEVTVNGKPYALKLFRTFPSDYYPEVYDWGDRETYPTSTVLAKYFKPFNRECRAYARIEQQQIGHLFWRCYGYLRLPATSRQKLYHVTGLCDFYWQVREPHSCESKYHPSRTLEHQLNWPIYGLVKELAPADSPAIEPKARSVRTMLYDLKKLHKIGVINDDLADRNYILGRIVDFSSSYTLPHIWFDRANLGGRSFWTPSFEVGAKDDLIRFRKAIIRSGVKTKVVVEKAFETPHEGRTRARRLRVFERLSYWPPLYEMGVREVTPESEDSMLNA